MRGKKKGAAPVSGGNGLTFEQAIQQLEKIVGDMETAELPLEDVIKKYEEGTRLVRFCSQKLEEAEKKIEILGKKSDGTVTLEPFEAEQSEDEAEEEEPSDEGGKLF